MAYILENDETVRGGLRRCAEEQLDRAVSELGEHIATDPVNAVHSARKAVKRERSLLRLMRSSMPADLRRRENRALRDAARELSGARDAEAMLDTFAGVSKRYVGHVPERSFDVIGDELEDGLARSYRDGRRAFAQARSRRSTEPWHEWRKRAKDLWYQERLLKDVAGPAVGGHAKDAHLLADMLGDIHDLAVLRRTLSEKFHGPVDSDAIVALIDHRVGQLQEEALCIGARVYAEKPKAFVRRVRRMWKAGTGHARVVETERPLEAPRVDELVAT